MALICPACSHPNEQTALFCTACNRPLTEGQAAGDLIGKEILGTYRLVELLGQGGMAVVYRARHMLTDQEVAVKVLPPELAEQREVKARFIEEARTLARLEHPNIVALHNFVEADGILYLVMQCAEGESFDKVIERQGRVELGEAVAVGIEVLRALEYAHEHGVIHRDIKPSNIVIRGDGSVKVMDFGIAKIMGSSKLTQTGQTMGTVRYMSPEQVRGKLVDHRTDLYSLGCMLYEAITGHTPFDGDNHFEIMQKHLTTAPPPPSASVPMPPELEEALLKSMAKPLDQRFASARDFRHALQRVPVDWEGRKANKSAILPEITAELEKSLTSRPRRPVRFAPALLALLLVLISVGVVIWAVLEPGRRPVKAAQGTGEGSAVSEPEKRPWPKPHWLVAQLKWKASRTYGPPAQLQVLTMRERDLDAVKAFYVRARSAYHRFLKEEGMSMEFNIGPLNLCVVDQATLQNKSYWPDVKPNVTYPTRYLAPTATLYVNDSDGFMESDLPYGLAIHFCARIAELSNERCLELAEGFELYLRKQK